MYDSFVSAIGRSPVYAALLVYGYGQATAEEAEGLTRALALPAEAKAALDEAWAHLTDNAPGAPLEIALLGRTVTLPRFAHGVGRAAFADLCSAALGPADFLAIAEHAEQPAACCCRDPYRPGTPARVVPKRPPPCRAGHRAC